MVWVRFENYKFDEAVRIEKLNSVSLWTRRPGNKPVVLLLNNRVTKEFDGNELGKARRLVDSIQNLLVSPGDHVLNAFSL